MAHRYRDELKPSVFGKLGLRWKSDLHLGEHLQRHDAELVGEEALNEVKAEEFVRCRPRNLHSYSCPNHKPRRRFSASRNSGAIRGHS